MLITRKSQVSGITRTKHIRVTEEQLQDWENGTVIQQAMPHLSDDDREFILTGITPEEWDELFGDEE